MLKTNSQSEIKKTDNRVTNPSDRVNGFSYQSEIGTQTVNVTKIVNNVIFVSLACFAMYVFYSVLTSLML